MNKIIPITKLAEELAAVANLTVDQANTFIRAYFDTAHAMLTSGQDLTVDGLGTFRLTGDTTEPLVFEPADQLATRVNAPFESFSPVEIPAGITVPDTPAVKTTSSESQVPVSAPQAPQATQTPPPAPVQAPQEPADDTETAGDVPPEPPTQATPPTPQTPPAPPTDSDQSDMSDQSDKTDNCDYGDYSDNTVQPDAEPVCRYREHCDMRWLWITLAFVLGGIIGFGAGFLLHNSLSISIVTGVNNATITNSDTDETDSEDLTVPADTLANGTDDVVPSADTQQTTGEAAQSQQTVQARQDAGAQKSAPVPAKYDTITETTFLTTLARRHYGQMEYWVYIYEANPSLGNPNTIKPGTRVIIPDASQLPLTGNKDKDIAAAKQKSAEIYARYPRRR